MPYLGLSQAHRRHLRRDSTPFEQTQYPSDHPYLVTPPGPSLSHSTDGCVATGAISGKPCHTNHVYVSWSCERQTLWIPLDPGLKPGQASKKSLNIIINLKQFFDVGCTEISPSCTALTSCPYHTEVLHQIHSLPSTTEKNTWRRIGHVSNRGSSKSIEAILPSYRALRRSIHGSKEEPI